MRAVALVAFMTLALAVAAPLSAGQAVAPGDTVDPGITDGSKQRRLDTARKAWKATNVRSYSYMVQLSCFCPNRPDVKMVVRGGRPAAGSPKYMQDVATVPRLFRKIQRAIDAKVASIRVSYAKRGFPKSIAIDVDRRIADEESYYTVTRFNVL